MQVALKYTLHIAEAGKMKTVYFYPVPVEVACLPIGSKLTPLEDDPSILFWIEGHDYHLEKRTTFIVVTAGKGMNRTDKENLERYLGKVWLSRETYAKKYLCSSEAAKMPEPRW